MCFDDLFQKGSRCIIIGIIIENLLLTVKADIDIFDDLGEDCSVQREIAALSMIADVVKWHYSMQVPPQTLSVRCDEYLETYTRYWERNVPLSN